MKESLFPKFEYYLDESDSDIVILRRQDGSFVAAFSASGATRDGIDEAAREDYWELVQAHTNVLSRKSQERLSS
jgi:3-oxoacyl-ACP reductase-like protein